MSRSAAGRLVLDWSYGSIGLLSEKVQERYRPFPGFPLRLTLGYLLNALPALNISTV